MDQDFFDHCDEHTSTRDIHKRHPQLGPKYIARKRRFELLDEEYESENPPKNFASDGEQVEQEMGNLDETNVTILERDPTERPDENVLFTEEWGDLLYESEDSNDSAWTDDKEISGSAAGIVSWIVASLFSIQLAHNISNACLAKFLLLFCQIFSVLSPFSEMCKVCSKLFPSSLFVARKLLNLDNDNFQKYIVCTNCCAIYTYDSVVHGHNGTLVANKCNNMVYSCRSADKSQRKKGRVKCNSPLMEKVINKTGKITYSPFKVYCYNSVINSLEKMLQRPSFVEKCNLWRHREIPLDVFADIYDGNVWKCFQEWNGSDFLTKEHDFGCMINVDWYQPFSRRSDKSIGAIYMVLLNLPREERYKKENCILIGVIPSLSKEPESLNSFLQPLVLELKALWKGIHLFPSGYSNPVNVRMALMCGAADIPAARKLCGYLGHGAIQGCSHCSKPLWNNGSHDCGIPDLEKWPNRSREDHLKYAEKARSAETLTKMKEIEKRHGFRYTPLLELPYFDPGRMTAIDPMHNLFLGTAKKMFSFWIEKEVLSKCHLESITARIRSINMPSHIGRIPVNIATNYGQMTAKEWKNWVLVYSMFCLTGILDTLHIRIWHTFVLACRHFCQPVMTRTNLEIASKLMTKFCKEVIGLYGKQFVTPNMHLHCHLEESVKNYGSIYGFWLFSFERYNGILSDMPTNMKDIEVQLMRKFNMFLLFDPSSVNPHFRDNFYELTKQPAREQVLTSSPELTLASSLPIKEVSSKVWGDLSLLKISDADMPISNLEAEDMKSLKKVYSNLYQKDISLDKMSHIHQKLSAINWCNATLGSDLQVQSGTNNIVSALWADDHSEIAVSPCLRPAKIKYFLVHNLELFGHPVKHLFVCVEWFKKSSEQFGYLNPISVWSSKLQNDGPACFIPVQRLDGKCAWFEEVHHSQKYMIVCPLPRAVYL